MEIKVIIADDHSIVRMGLSTLIKEFNVQVVDEVATCNELMQNLMIHKSPPLPKLHLQKKPH